MGIGGSSRILHRRGMSPLIATVLLMAFAVALGGMIMNWSVDVSKGGDCEAVKVRVTQFCAKDDKIFLSLRNDAASTNIREVKISILESNVESMLRIKNSALAPGQPLENIAVPAVTTPNTRVELIGVTGSETNPVTCTEPLHIADPIADCK